RVRVPRQGTAPARQQPPWPASGLIRIPATGVARRPPRAGVVLSGRRLSRGRRTASDGTDRDGGDLAGAAAARLPGLRRMGLHVDDLVGGRQPVFAITQGLVVRTHGLPGAPAGEAAWTVAAR